MRLQEQEKNAPQHATETLTYIAWEPTVGQTGGSDFEVQRTARVMTEAWRTIPFTGPFLHLPVVLAALQTTYGFDPAAVRWDKRDFSSVALHVQEEQSQDVEMLHTPEVVGYVAFASSTVLAAADGVLDAVETPEDIDPAEPTSTP